MKTQLMFTSLSLSLVALFTTNNNFTNANALLTAPAEYDIAFRFRDNPSPAPDFWSLDVGSEALTGSQLSFDRTTDSSYYNYSATFDTAYFDEIPQGLSITNTFNRSNTAWSGTGGGGYYPTDTKIGSDNTVGSVQKIIFNYDNQTKYDYKIALDLSSTVNDTNILYKINGFTYITYFSATITNASTMNYFYLPAFTYVEIQVQSGTSARYFDAWYLEDLGQSASWGEGYTDGYIDGFTDGEDNAYPVGYDDGYEDGLSALEDTNSGLLDILSSLFGAVGNVFNIYVFPGITMGMLVFVPIIFAMLLFVIKLLRGGS